MDPVSQGAKPQYTYRVFHDECYVLYPYGIELNIVLKDQMYGKVSVYISMYLNMWVMNVKIIWELDTLEIHWKLAYLQFSQQ